jgi:adenylate cyclase
VLSIVAWVGLSVGWFHGFQLRASDAVFPRDRVDDRVVVVGVDAASVGEIGAWPWPRAVQAELVRRLADAGAKVVALDVVYAPAAAGDDELASALASTPSIVATAVQLDRRPGARFFRVANAIRPTGALGRATVLGHAGVTPDGADGLVRTLPLVVEDGRSFVPSLSLAALARMLDTDPVPVVRPHAVQIGDRSVPTDGATRLRISYPPTPRIVPAADVLDGRADVSEFDGTVVFVGVTDTTIADRVLTPVDRGGGTPGVVVHAAAFNTMLRRTFLSTSPRATTVALVFAAALLTALAVQLLPVSLAGFLALLLVVGYVVLGVLQADHGRLVDFVYPVLAVVIAVPASGAVRYVLEVRQRRRVSQLFAQYVPEWVSRELVDGDHERALTDGQAVHATVLFCDIRGFTAMTGALAPTQVRTLLDSYYDALSRIILDHDGTVLRYVGDEVYAVFGAPLESSDHASAAVACAFAVQDANAALNEELSSRGLPAIAYGIGMNTGDLISTVVGSHLRRQYAVIGNAVNLGARLCALAGAGEIVVSDGTFLALDEGTVVSTTFSAELKGIEGMSTVHRLTKAVRA